MKRKTVSELICPWLQVHYPTLGTRQVDLYAKVSRVNVYVWRPKVLDMCLHPWYRVCTQFAPSSLATIRLTCYGRMIVWHKMC